MATDSGTTEGSLDRQLFHGIAWTAVLRWITQAVSWMGTFYAARLLGKGDYGLVAMATFYHEPHVAYLISALSVIFLLDSLQIVPRAMLQRQLRYRTLAAVGAFQMLATTITLVICATAGLGPWSLVLNTIAGGVAVTAILAWLAPHSLAWPAEVSSYTRPIVAGWRVLVTRACWYGYNNTDQLLIGRVLGKDALGAYTFSMSFAGLPTQEVTSVVARVVPGVFSEVQTCSSDLRRYFLLLTEAMSYLAFPAAIGLALTAELVVAIALGPQWEAVVLPLRILCLYYAVYAAQTLVSQIQMWTGHFRANMWFTVLGLCGLVAGFAGTVRFGIVAVAWSWVVVFPLVSFPPLVSVARLIDVPLRRFFGSLGPATVACLGMSGVVLLVRDQLPSQHHDVPRLAIEAAAGAATYIGILALAFRRRVTLIVRTVLVRQ